MSILGNLISELSNEAPKAASPEEQQGDLFEAKRTWKKPERQAVGGDAHSRGGDLIYLLRDPGFPAAVYALDWGGPIPYYVDYCDGIYEVTGWAGRVSYSLIEWNQPPWLAADPTCDPPPEGLCCLRCGRRLFYRCDSGEFCACCFFPTFKVLSRLHVAESYDSLEAAQGRLKFFLLPGVGLDW